MTRSHQFHDLQPYVCIYEDCITGGRVYGSSREWQAHLEQHKIPAQPSGNLRQCPICKQTCDQEEYISHVAREMQKLSLFVVPSELFDGSAEVGDEIIIDDLLRWRVERALNSLVSYCDDPENETTIKEANESQKRRQEDFAWRPRARREERRRRKEALSQEERLADFGDVIEDTDSQDHHHLTSHHDPRTADYRKAPESAVASSVEYDGEMNEEVEGTGRRAEVVSRHTPALLEAERRQEEERLPELYAESPGSSVRDLSKGGRKLSQAMLELFERGRRTSIYNSRFGGPFEEELGTDLVKGQTSFETAETEETGQKKTRRSSFKCTPSSG